MNSIKIQNLKVGDFYKPIIIAEVGQAHLGDFNKAKKYIDAAVFAGADCIKFQTHIALEESTEDDVFRSSNPYKKLSRYNYWKKMEFSYEQWFSLKKYADKKKIIFLSSAFSIKAFEILSKIKVQCWKLGSGEYKSMDLIDKMVSTKKPILFSTGIMNNAEINFLAKYLILKKSKFAIFQCTSMYPTDPKNIGLNILTELKKKYKCPIGLSDHSGTIYPSLAAMTLGANIIEVHFKIEDNKYNLDSKASLNINDLKTVCDGSQYIYTLIKSKTNKNRINHQAKIIKKNFTKSIAVKINLKKGSILTKDIITFKKPGNGIDPNDIDKILGKKIIKDIKNTKLLKWSDIEK
tara:strand:- start:3978 stop:5024 length:1047 start_codon:yes stop_codon:yes gene_type:complete